MEIACLSGTVNIVAGTRFRDRDLEWEVIAFPGATSYSPIGLGGTPTVLCKPLGKLPLWCEQWADKDGNVEWCGDSVAAHVLANADGKRRSARGDILTSRPSSQPQE